MRVYNTPLAQPGGVGGGGVVLLEGEGDVSVDVVFGGPMGSGPGGE